MTCCICGSVALRRAHADEYAVRVNRAVELLIELSPADAVHGLQAEFGLSERQGRRYMRGAGAGGGRRGAGAHGGVHGAVGAVTDRWLRERAQASGVSLSAATAAAVAVYLEQAGEASGPVVRPVEIEFVGDRLADARLAQAYVILAPERRRVTHSERSGSERERQRRACW